MEGVADTRGYNRIQGKAGREFPKLLQVEEVFSEDAMLHSLLGMIYLVQSEYDT